MAKQIPFDEDVLTMIMGVGGPEEPGQHGRTNAPMPTSDAIDLVTSIRDMCDDWLKKVGKDQNDDDSEPSSDAEDVTDGKSDTDKEED